MYGKQTLNARNARVAFYPTDVREPLLCPSCGEEIWDGPRGSKLAKCWNDHPETGGPLAFDTMDDDDD